MISLMADNESRLLHLTDYYQVNYSGIDICENGFNSLSYFQGISLVGG
jgi:hypothetical protein